MWTGTLRAMGLPISSGKPMKLFSLYIPHLFGTKIFLILLILRRFYPVRNDDPLHYSRVRYQNHSGKV